MKILKSSTAGVLAFALALTAAPSARAEAAFNQAPHVAVKELESGIAAYSDLEILELLLAGVGPIADANPEIVTEYLGFDPDRPEVNQIALEQLVADYLEFEPEFRSQVVPGLSVGEPLAVEHALLTFTESFHAYLETIDTSTVSSGSPTGRGGWAWAMAYVAVAVNGVVYANAAVATLALVAGAAVVVVVVVPGYLKGEKDGASASSLGSQEMILNASNFFRSVR